MPYETGNTTDPDDLLQKIRSFSKSNGWSENLYTADEKGFRCHLKHKQLFINLRSINNDNRNRPYYENYGIAINGSDGFDANESWDKQPNAPKSTTESITPMMDSLEQGQHQYHFFALKNPMVIICVVEYQASRYQYLTFGEIKKYGLFKGGLFFSASWSAGGQHTWANNNGPFNDDAGSNYSSSYLRADVEAFQWLSAGEKVSTGGQSTDRLVRARTLWQDGLITTSPSTFNQLPVLTPIHLFAERDSGFFSPLGELDHIRYINIKDKIPGSIIKIGAVKWMIFPFHFIGEQTAENNYEATGDLGYAVRYQP